MFYKTIILKYTLSKSIIFDKLQQKCIETSYIHYNYIIINYIHYNISHTQ